MPETLPLESLVLAAILDDGISPGFIHERLAGSDGVFRQYLDREHIDVPSPEQIAEVLKLALARGLATLMNEQAEPVVGEWPEGPYTPDYLAFQMWFELTTTGEQIAEAALKEMASDGDAV